MTSLYWIRAQEDCPGYHWRHWRQASTSPVTTWASIKYKDDHLTSIGNPIVKIRWSDDHLHPHNGISYTGKITSIGNPIVEIRRSDDRLISTMEFPILVRWHLYIESGPRAVPLMTFIFLCSKQTGNIKMLKLNWKLVDEQQIKYTDYHSSMLRKPERVEIVEM